ncbi:hypothetical protein EJ08DRAFT_120830 [Tothia fuscella]|uniref:Uncharacterized protein n=1 Tax=Tothia fuscella TaxID=1048955 RepID=A0A9P4NVP7_9PEZI|nr:hypothetical protein EJ08DRAFT_120830 [Tothia fuscella]
MSSMIIPSFLFIMLESHYLQFHLFRISIPSFATPSSRASLHHFLIYAHTKFALLASGSTLTHAMLSYALPSLLVHASHRSESICGSGSNFLPFPAPKCHRYETSLDMDFFHSQNLPSRHISPPRHLAPPPASSLSPSSKFPLP